MFYIQAYLDEALGWNTGIENRKGRIKMNYFISLIGLHNTLIWYIKEKEE